MWKKIIFGLAFLSLFLQSNDVFAEKEHLEKLKSKYPYGLLGDDYGILKVEDLAINACDRYLRPFSEEESTPYQYWQCFKVKDATISCEGGGYDEGEHTRLALLVIAAPNKNGYHEYFHDRTMPLNGCKEHVREWKRLVRAESYVCISGSFVNKEKDKAGRWVFHWDFDRFKTKKGCDSYFEGGCSLKYQLDHDGCKIE